MKRRRNLLIIILLALLCIPGFTEARAKGKRAKKEAPPPVVLPWEASQVPESLERLDQMCRADERRNLVLHLLRFGKHAMNMGESDLAKQAFDEALSYIESIEANAKDAQKAKSKFKEEATKFFKGEPYERSLAYFYRGALYLQDGDYENARACFRSGQFHDASESEMYQGDYVLLYYLEGKCNQILGKQQAEKESFQRAATTYESLYLRPALLPSTSSEANCILIVEAGPAPIKYGFGKYDQELGYARNLRAPRPAYCALVIDGEQISTSRDPIEDVFFQSVTRGGRIADSYNKGKAAFKSFTAVAGNIGLAAGAGLMASADDTDELLAGAAVTLVGGLFKAMSSGAKPNADTRYWDNLPEEFHLFVLDADEAFDARVELYDSNDKLISSKDIGHIEPNSTGVEFVLVP